MEAWKFGQDNDNLVKLVLSGEKTATTSIYDKNNIPRIGEQSIITFNDSKKACVIKIKDVIITEFKNVDSRIAVL